MGRSVVVTMDGRPFRQRRGARLAGGASAPIAPQSTVPLVPPVAHVGPWREAGPAEQPGFILRSEANVLGIPMSLVAIRVFAPRVTGLWNPETPFEADGGYPGEYGPAWDQEALARWVAIVEGWREEDGIGPKMPGVPARRETRAAKRLLRTLLTNGDDPDALMMVRGTSAYAVTGVASGHGEVPPMTPAWFQFSRFESVRATDDGWREFVEFPVTVSGAPFVLTLRLRREMDIRSLRLLMPDALSRAKPAKAEWRGLLWHAELWPCQPNEGYWLREPRFVPDISRTDPRWLEGAESRA